MNSESIGQYWKYQRQISKKAFGCAVVVGLIIFVSGYKSVARGLLLGSMFSVLNFTLMAVILPYQVGYQRNKATMIACASLFSRLAMLAVPIAIGFYFDRFNLVATIVGLFTVPIFLLFDRVILARIRGEYNL